MLNHKAGEDWRGTGQGVQSVLRDAQDKLARKAKSGVCRLVQNPSNF